MKKRSNTRGFTLVELSIVMALVAILAVMIVSFTSLTSLRVGQASARSDCMDAFGAYRTAVVDGFAEKDAPGAVFSWSYGDDGITVDGTTFALPEEITAVTAESNGTLLRVTMINDGLSLTESFVIASHCGATFFEGGGT